MSKSNDILNKMRSRRNGAETFMETMYEHVQETKQEQQNEQETKQEHEQKTEQLTGHKNESVPVQESIQQTVDEYVKEPITEMIQQTSYDTDNVPIPVPKSKSILEKYSEKKTKEDLYTRQTYLIRNDLIKRFDKAAQSRRKGFKTDVINELLENFLNENGL